MTSVIRNSVTDFSDNSVLMTVPKDHVIVIDVSYQFDEEYRRVTASVGSVDNIAKTEFNSFVNNVLGILEQYHFEIVDKHRTNRRNSLSYYIAFYPTDEHGQTKDKYIVFFRLSNHDIPGLEVKSRQYHENMDRKHKRSSRRIQPYDFVNIVIDGKALSSYGAAVDYVYDIAEDMYTGKYWN